MSKGKVYDYLMSVLQEKGCGHMTLIDPDFGPPEKLAGIAAGAEAGGTDAIMLGGSGGDRSKMDETAKRIKEETSVPLILFPGNVNDVTPEADAIFFMSLMNSRSRYWLSLAQTFAAFTVKQMGIEPIPMSYLVIESDKRTSVEFYGDVNPIPREKPKIAAAFALAAQYLGMKLVYLEGGSGARQSVPEEMIRFVSRIVDIPVIVGGGITTPEEAGRKVKAGASFIVTGTAVEKSKDPEKTVKSIIKAMRG